MPRNSIIRKAEKTAVKKLAPGLFKDLSLVLGVGLAAGAVLIATTDKVMKTAFPEKNEKKLQNNKSEETSGCVQAQTPEKVEETEETVSEVETVEPEKPAETIEKETDVFNSVEPEVPTNAVDADDLEAELEEELKKIEVIKDKKVKEMADFAEPVDSGEVSPSIILRTKTIFDELKKSVADAYKDVKVRPEREPLFDVEAELEEEHEVEKAPVFEPIKVIETDPVIEEDKAKDENPAVEELKKMLNDCE